MGRRNYEGSKKQHIIKLLNNGYSDHNISELYGYDYRYIKHVRQRAAKEIEPAFYFQSTGSTEAKLNGKLDTYNTNELEYGTFRPKYKIEEVEIEYDISNKPPTMFAACRTIRNA